MFRHSTQKFEWIVSVTGTLKAFSGGHAAVDKTAVFITDSDTVVITAAVSVVDVIAVCFLVAAIMMQDGRGFRFTEHVRELKF